MGIDITVVIPAYNAGSFIEEAIESILYQTVRPDEIIVVDDCSGDDTVRRVKAFGAEVTLIENKNHTGSPSLPYNAGIDAAHTTYVLPFDADDTMRREKIERHISALKRKPLPFFFHDEAFFGPGARTDKTFCDLNGYFRRHLQPLGGGIYMLSQKHALETLMHEHYIGAGALLFRKDAWKAVGGFDPHLMSAEDRDFCVRLAQRYPFGYIDEVLVDYRVNPAGKMANKIENFTCGIDVLCRHLRLPLRPSTRQAALDTISEMEMELVWQYGDRGDFAQAFIHWWRGLAGGGVNMRTVGHSRKLAVHLTYLALRKLFPRRRRKLTGPIASFRY